MCVHQSIDAASFFPQSDAAFLGLLVTSEEDEMDRPLISKLRPSSFRLRHPGHAIWELGDRIDTSVQHCILAYEAVVIG